MGGGMGPMPMPGGPMGGVGGAPMPGDRGAGIVGKDGKALLSWRVALLPYLEQQQLYKQFHLDEPWDSPHNIKLLKQMPKVFAPPGVKTREPHSTFYQVFVGPHAAFEKHRALRMPGDFTDGLSYIILIAEAGSAVPWTKPEDLHFAPDEPVPQLGGLFPGLFHVAMADGSVVALSKRIDAETLARAIMRDDGHPINLDPFKAPLSRREAELRQQHDHLKIEVEKERSRLEELRREKKELQEQAEDAASDGLKKENAQLEAELRRLRDETRQLRDEIERLKKPRERKS
jgi:hypothetical protein